MKLPDIDVEDFLRSQGIRNVTRRGKEVSFSCPMPDHANGDQSPSASMNVRSTAFFCYGCKWKGNAVTFICDYEKVSPMQAFKWIEERYGGGFVEPVNGVWESLVEILEPKPREEDILVELPESEFRKRKVDWRKVVEAGSSAPAALRYMIDRDFMWDTLEEFGFGFDPYTTRITLPIRGEDGALLGFKGRAWHPDHEPKYLVLGDREPHGPQGFAPYDAARVVFGLDTVERKETHGIVCEGELNVVAMRQMGFDNTVGIGGSFLSEEHVRILRRRFNRVTFLVDCDQPGHDLVFGRQDSKGEHVPGAGEMLSMYVSVYVVPMHDDDPAGNMDRRYWQTMLDRAVPFLTAMIGGGFPTADQ